MTPPAFRAPALDPRELEALSRVEPPAYLPVVLRGGQTRAMAEFRDAMSFYSAGNYEAAIPGLRSSAALSADAPSVHFFLAASLLLTSQPRAAAASFEKTIAMGDSPFLEEAHFYLAKSYIHERRWQEARAALQEVVLLRGQLGTEAARLLEILRKRPAP